MFEMIESYYDYLEKDNNLLDNDNLPASIRELRDRTVDKEIKAHCSAELSIIKCNIDKRFNDQVFSNPILLEGDFKYIESRVGKLKKSKYQAILLEQKA